MGEGLQLHPGRIREQIRRLRAWQAEWVGQMERAQRASIALIETVRAAPGHGFQTKAAAHQRHLGRIAEQVERLARALEQALERLEHAYVTTTFDDLATVARSYGVKVDRFETPRGDQHPDAVWGRLKERLGRGEDVIALVHVTGSNYSEPPIPNEIPGTGLRFSDERTETPLRPGGRLRPWNSEGVAHWVVLNRMGEHNGARFIVINNPFNNRTERYRWEDFLNAVDGQVRDDPQWWFLSIRREEG